MITDVKSHSVVFGREEREREKRKRENYREKKKLEQKDRRYLDKVRAQ